VTTSTRLARLRYSQFAEPIKEIPSLGIVPRRGKMKKIREMLLITPYDRPEVQALLLLITSDYWARTGGAIITEAGNESQVRAPGFSREEAGQAWPSSLRWRTHHVRVRSQV